MGKIVTKNFSEHLKEKKCLIEVGLCK